MVSSGVLRHDDHVLLTGMENLWLISVLRRICYGTLVPALPCLALLVCVWRCTMCGLKNRLGAEQGRGLSSYYHGYGPDPTPTEIFFFFLLPIPFPPKTTTEYVAKRCNTVPLHIHSSETQSSNLDDLQSYISDFDSAQILHYLSQISLREYFRGWLAAQWGLGGTDVSTGTPYGSRCLGECHPQTISAYTVRQWMIWFSRGSERSDFYCCFLCLAL